MYKKLVILFLMISANSYCQGNVTGKIIYDNNQPLPGANVYWENTEIGTTSDEQGKFIGIKSQGEVRKINGYKCISLDGLRKNSSCRTLLCC